MESMAASKWSLVTPIYSEELLRKVNGTSVCLQTARVNPVCFERMAQNHAVNWPYNLADFFFFFEKGNSS